MYLEALSCHEKSSRNDTYKGTVLNLCRICSTMGDFQKKCQSTRLIWLLGDMQLN